MADASGDLPTLQLATQQLCALCAALDRAPPLEFPRARLSIREWLREHLELVRLSASRLSLQARNRQIVRLRARISPVLPRQG